MQWDHLGSSGKMTMARILDHDLFQYLGNKLENINGKNKQSKYICQFWYFVTRTEWNDSCDFVKP